MVCAGKKVMAGVQKVFGSLKKQKGMRNMRKRRRTRNNCVFFKKNRDAIFIF
jgi:hypothetical protein